MKYWMHNPASWFLILTLFITGAFSSQTASAASAPSITTQPQSQSALVGSNATFSVVATGTAPLSYQWSLNGTNVVNSTHIGGATGSILTITNLVATDAGVYHVVVSNSHGTATSSNATLTVLFPAAITTQPVSQSVFLGGTARFPAAATGTQPLNFQWYFNGAPLADAGRISGSLTATLTISNVQLTDAGGYDLVASNFLRAATSSNATLTPVPVTHYVNLNGSNPQPPYSSWNTAATNIQDAVDAANAGETIVVTNGIYPLGNRIVAGVTNRVAVNLPLFLTSASGPASTWIDGGGAARCVYLTNGCSFSGFTVTNGASSQNGGGVCCAGTNVVITNCVFTGNSAYIQGGGVYQGTLIDCLLTNNSAGGNAAGYPAGGGAGSSVLLRCLLTGNSGGFATGGAMYNCIANQCLLTNNSCGAVAGGAALSTLNNCLVFNNYAGSVGGGAYNCTLNNCTVAGNTANFGPGGGIDGGAVNNCIVYYNTSPLIIQFGGTPDQTNCANCTVSNSCTFPLMTNGVANITNLPAFIDPNSDWHLQSNSPCINAGNNSYATGGVDVDGHPRIVGPIVDMGAYEYQAPTIAITAQPSSQALLLGSTAQFGLAAISAFPLGYRWYFNGTPLTDGGRISGSATTNLNVSNIQPADTGQYQLVVTNNYTSATSAVATLTVLVPANITTPPLSQSVLLSSNVTFSAAAGGTAPLNAQWYFNGAPLTDGGRISGSTTTNLNIQNVQAGDAGPYQLVVTNNYGSASNVATLSVLIPARVVQSPPSQSVLVTSNATFSVIASGTAPLNAQWYFNGAPLTDGGRISGSTTTNLNILNVQTNDAGPYQFVVTNNYGSDTSAVAVLTVIAAPVILKPLTNQVTMIYSNVTLSIVVTDAPPVYFQWQKNGTNLTDGGNISGSASPNLTISNPQLSDSGPYSVIVSNSWGTVMSSEILTVSPVLSWGIAVTTPPASVTNVMAIASAGTSGAADFAIRTDGSIVGWGNNFYGILDIPSNATNLLTITAGPEQAIAVRPDGSVVSWGYGGTNVPDYVTNVVATAVESFGSCIALRQDGSVVAWNGASTPPANATNVIAIGAGFYSCLAVLQNGTVIGWGDNSSGEISPPASATNVIAVGGGANGTYTYSMALRADGTAVGFGLAPGIPTAATNLTAIAPGDYHWLGLFQNGTAMSFGLNGPSPTNCMAIAASGDGEHDTVLVQDPNLALPPRFIQQPLSVTTQTNQTAILLSRAIGSLPLQFQWYFNGAPIAGQTNNWLGLNGPQASQGGNYQVVVTNNFGSAASTTAAVWIPPVIGTQPSATVIFGSNTSFSVTAAGTPPFGYQWYFNGTPLTDGGRITGSTTTNLTVSNFQPSDLGNYVVIVTNAAGSATSAPATITVLNPLITAQPPNRVQLGGTTATFSVSATGQSPLAYQWLYNGNSIPGATTNPLVLTNLMVNQSGTYSVIVSNIYSSIQSSNASLTVTALTISTQPTNRVTWVGGSAAFRVNVSGTAPFTFEWRCNNVDVPGLYSNILVLTNVQPSQFGTYSVIVGNAYGTVTSTNVFLFPSQVVVWGGMNGETNLPPGLTNIIAVSGSQASISDCLVLRSNGMTIQWPNSPNPFVVSNVTNLVAITCGGGNGPNLGLRPDGTVISWLYDSPLPVRGLTNVAAIAPYNGNYFALRTNGTVYNVNVAGPGTPPFVTNLINVVAISAGYQHELVLKADGTTFAWGSDAYFQTNVPPGLSNVIAIAAGGYHNLALKSDHTVVAWGRNLEHQTNVPVNLSNVVAIAAGQYHSLALKADGTVVAWGLGTQGQTNIPAGLSNIVAIAAGQYHNLALIGNGPPPLQALAVNPTVGSNGFSLTVPSQSGHVYILQYKNTLSDPNWISLPLVPGNGGPLLLTDPSPPNSQRYYQVQQW